MCEFYPTRINSLLVRGEGKLILISGERRMVVSFPSCDIRCLANVRHGGVSLRAHGYILSFLVVDTVRKSN